MVRRVDVAPRRVDPNGLPERIGATPVTPTDPYGSLRRRTTSIAEPPISERLHPNHEVGFGGFPGPKDVLERTSQKLFPQLHRTLQQTLTIPRTATLIPEHPTTAESHSRDPAIPTRPVPYLSFPADVGKNSRFKSLSEEQLLELGGVEYSALNVLMWVVPLVSYVHVFPPSA